MTEKQVKISEIKRNPANPRVILDEKYTKLLNSLLVFPKMLQARPIVVDKQMVVLGGNMRLKALQEIATFDNDELYARLQKINEMNNIVIAGYISGIESKKENEITTIKFQVCDNQSEDSRMWFACYYKTKSDKMIDFLKEKKEKKHQFTIVGTMFYNYNTDNEKTYINIMVKQIC